ncbi:P-loop containing nucleoside triphosphate hydrolase protein [Obba rivulosa]|uniref:P-loop containing nucleoside triphosphate hydrolase protein n=1 Tax=Obba rivulosa TaxID=1052685 RepID=A0A8E2DU08_9APHY|nr:P-loop containing nucleoside triphosphate hydrolase protein [Obba rivulosa]
MGRKRKEAPATEGEAGSNEAANSESKPAKKSRNAKSKGKTTMRPTTTTTWPEHFQYVSALNTVLAFCSSRKNFAVTFPVVRLSVEQLLKEPLELARVAELKALLPDTVKFGYIPREELRIHGDSQDTSGRRKRSPDFEAFAGAGSSSSIVKDEDEHVLVLDFMENSRGKLSTNPGFAYALPPALTPAAMKKLVERRNNRFVEAVNELLEATRQGDDPVALLQAAARDHIPINPSGSASVSTMHTEAKGKQKAVPDPEDRPTIDAVLEELLEQEWYQEQLTSRRTFDAREGRTASLETPLSERIQQAIRDSRKITSLYIHQVAAIDALARERSVIVSTSTASGKSIIYQASSTLQVPVLKFLEEDSQATAMFIYPTKALAQDQRIALEQLLYYCPGLEHTKVYNYDGDTPQELRAGIRESASVIFTNFDMLHTSILPHEDLWRRRFLKNLKLVAVDELHYYSNIFGSHVAQVLRRFRRVCAAVGNRRIRFVSCSATISKPGQHMKNMFGIDDVEEITEDGAPSGRKDFLVWNPPLKDPMDATLGRQSSMSEATRLMRYLMTRGVRVILFCKAICELAMKTLRAELTAEGRLDILDRVMAYRGGYSQQDRRRIEKEAFTGNLLGIVATNALELGVDIGVLDAVIMLGFPMGGLASFRQQAGRAGRRARDALAVFIPDPFPIDQHFVKNPDELFDKATDDLILDLESNVIVEAHLQCAAHEMPLTLEDEKYFGPLTKEICETCLVKDSDGWYHVHPKFLPFPAKHIALRGAEEEKYSVVDITKLDKAGGTARILEEVELSRALFEIYEGAVFIHQGVTFLVKEVSHDSKMARVLRTDVNWITSPRDFTNIDAAQTYRIRALRNSPHHAYYGRQRLQITSCFAAHYCDRNKAIIDAIDLETPPFERNSTGMWIDVPKQTLELMKRSGINPAEAIHAAEHAFLNRFALRADMKTECKIAEKEYKAGPSERKRPARLIFYEPSGKTGGTAVKAFDHASDLLQGALDAVETCQCEEGCTACNSGIDSPTCRSDNLVASKTGALIVLKAILGRPIDVDLIPEYPPDVQTFETVVEAPRVRAVEGVEIEAA